MPIVIEDNLAVLSGVCAVEEAEPLLEWARRTAFPAVDLATCTHMHTAVLQVLLAVRPQLAAAASDEFVARLCAGLLPAAPGRDGEP